MVNGKKTALNVMVEVFKYGQMVVDMKDIGKKIKQMLEESLHILTVMFMKENGLKIKHMVMEYIHI